MTKSPGFIVGTSVPTSSIVPQYSGCVSFQEMVSCSWRVVSATVSEIICPTRLLPYRPYLARYASSTCVRTPASATVKRTVWSTPPTRIRPLPFRRARRYQLPEGPRQDLTYRSSPTRTTHIGTVGPGVWSAQSGAMWISSAVPIVASSLWLHPLIRFVSPSSRVPAGNPVAPRTQPLLHEGWVPAVRGTGVRGTGSDSHG
jgi:hypothetical protein